MIVASKKKKRSFFSRCCMFCCVVAAFAAVTTLWNPDPNHPTSLLHIPTSHDNNNHNEHKNLQSRSIEIAKTPKIPGEHPSLSSLLQVDPNTQSINIIGNVQFLLQYAIIGFSKCGTTTLLKWIRRDPDVRSFKREIHEIIQDDNPSSLVERLYQNLLEEPPVNTTNPFFLQGFKNPEILQTPRALNHIHQYWPETKLIVSVRNPLKWFRSFYNFRLTIGHLNQVGPDPNALIGHCYDGNKLLCTHMGAFHAKLARLGKTPLNSNQEWDFIEPFLAPPEYQQDQDVWSWRNKIAPVPRMNNKVFFLDLRQMSDSNKTRAKLFREDLRAFLGLQHELTPVFRARPFKQLEWTLDEESKRHKIDTICNPKYLPLQQELYPMAQKASLWLRQYFLKSPDVVVSSPEYVEELLETWMHNPCEEPDKMGG